MAEGKRGFKIYADWKNWLSILTKEQKAEWVDWLFDYVNDLHPEMPNDQALLMACNMTRNALKIDLENYYKKIDAGKKGGIASQLKQKQAKESKAKQNEAQSSTIKQTEAKPSDMIRKDIDMICKDKICNDMTSINIEEDNIETLQQLIMMIECNIYSHNLSNADTETIRNISDKGYSYNSIYRDLKNYKDKGIKTPITYMKKALENAKIQEQVKPKQMDQEQKTYEINSWLDAFNIYYDEEAPQYIRDKAKKYMEDNKRGN